MKINKSLFLTLLSGIRNNNKVNSTKHSFGSIDDFKILKVSDKDRIIEVYNKHRIKVCLDYLPKYNLMGYKNNTITISKKNFDELSDKILKDEIESVVNKACEVKDDN